MQIQLTKSNSMLIRLAILPYLFGGFLLLAGGISYVDQGDEPLRSPTENVISQEGFLGEIKMFGGNFAPRGWAFCDGSLIQISQNTALFSIIGTMYGGDGRTTFALPDMRGRTAIHPGRGPGLTDRRVGQKIGQESHVLNINQMPSHTHAASGSLDVSDAQANRDNPVGNVLAKSRGGYIYQSAAPNQQMLGESVNITINNTGGNQAFDIMQPSLGINYIICLQGIFPSRN